MRTDILDRSRAWLCRRALRQLVLPDHPPDGLSDKVFPADADRAAGIAARLRVGAVNVNGGVWYSADAIAAQ